MAHRSRAGRKSWATRLLWQKGVTDSLLEIARAKEQKERSESFNTWDRSAEIVLTSLSSGQEQIVSAFKASDIILDWIQINQCLSFYDLGNNFCTRDAVLEILFSKATVFTTKATFKLKETL